MYSHIKSRNKYKLLWFVNGLRKTYSDVHYWRNIYKITRS